MNIRGETKEEAADDAHKAVAEGFPAIKDHFYHSVRENLQWFEAVRDAVGPDVEIMHDAVGIYTFEEALRIGRALEELDYRWFEGASARAPAQQDEGPVRRPRRPHPRPGDDDERRRPPGPVAHLRRNGHDPGQRAPRRPPPS